MDSQPSDLPDDLDALRAVAAAALARNADDAATIARQSLEIAKLRRQIYGPRSERTARLVEQMEERERTESALRQAQRLEAVAQFDMATTEKTFRELVAELGIPSGDLVHPVRLAISASDVGPGLFETMAVLGRDLTVERLKNAYAA